MMDSQSTRSTTPSATHNSGIVSCASSTPTIKVHESNSFSIQTLLERINEVSAYVSEHHDVDMILKEHDLLLRKNKVRKQRIAGYKKIIANLTSAKEVMSNEYEERHQAWCVEKVYLIKDHACETSKLQAELAEWKQQAASLAQELNNARRDAQIVKTELEVTAQTLAQWKQYASHVKPLDRQRVQPRIDDFFDKVHSTIRACFFPDLSSEILVKRDAWSSGLKHLQIRDLPFEMPLSNTGLDKLLRVALAMHITSKELTEQVFQPCYISNSIEQSARLQDYMRTWFKPKSKQRQLMRSLLLSTQTQEALVESLQERSSRARDDVVRKLSFMCNDGDTGLASRLEDVFVEAAKLWEEILYSEDEVQAVRCDDFEHSSWSWLYMPDFGKPLRNDRPNKKLLLFPGFYLVDSAEPLYNGYALFTDQEHVVDAERKYHPGPTPRAEGPSRRSSGLSPTIRRLSLSFSNTGSPPASPTTSSQENQSASVNGILNGLGVNMGSPGNQNGGIT